MEQRSEEWFAARLGKVTASKINDIMASGRSGEAVSRRNYRTQIISERLTGKREEMYVNAAMQHGIDTEDEARDAYVFDYADVEETGLIDHPTIPMSGASPDGLVGKDGLIEIKCPKTTTHTTTLISQKVPSHYMNQMMWQMACTGRDWCDFVSYSPFFPDNLKMFVRRVQRDEEHIKQLEDEVTKFLTEVEDTIKFLQGVK
jgi:putative phage-type endonuclease